MTSLTGKLVCSTYLLTRLIFKNDNTILTGISDFDFARKKIKFHTHSYADYSIIAKNVILGIRFITK